MCWSLPSFAHSSEMFLVLFWPKPQKYYQQLFHLVVSDCTHYETEQPGADSVQAAKPQEATEDLDEDDDDADDDNYDDDDDDAPLHADQIATLIEKYSQATATSSSKFSFGLLRRGLSNV
jgi:hypothetical protein